MGVYKVTDTGSNWQDREIDVETKVKTMVIKENQKDINIKKFKKYNK